MGKGIEINGPARGKFAGHLSDGEDIPVKPGAQLALLKQRLEILLMLPVKDPIFFLDLGWLADKDISILGILK